MKGILRLWDLTDGNETSLWSFEEHRGTVYRIAFTPDGRRVISIDGDGNIFLRGLP